MASETTEQTSGGAKTPDSNEAHDNTDFTTDPGAEPSVDGREQVIVGEVDEAGDTVPSLQAQIETLKQQAADSQEAFLRARADYLNLKRRSEEERDQLKQFVTGDLVLRLLPVVDNLERALAAAAHTSDYEKLIGGVNAVHKQLTTFLEKEGVTPIPALHQSFDPNLHNAVLRDEESDQPENTVVEELQKGYQIGERILRPTMVKVAVGK